MMETKGMLMKLKNCLAAAIIAVGLTGLAGLARAGPVTDNQDHVTVALNAAVIDHQDVLQGSPVAKIDLPLAFAPTEVVAKSNPVAGKATDSAVYARGACAATHDYALVLPIPIAVHSSVLSSDTATGGQKEGRNDGSATFLAQVAVVGYK